ncbi:MAG TPA: BrnA antitoxin family protein [Bryobacteraceae bacterium]|nr:BrnA antitoxin family protein [Bryobacteraceae bacterium]
MSKGSITTSSEKVLKVSGKTRRAYDERDKSRDNVDPDNPVLPPQFWDGAIVGRFYRPIKTQISFRIDNDVLEWLKSRGAGHLSRINEILRERMLAERRASQVSTPARSPRRQTG